MAGLRAAELETLLTVNLDDVAKAEKTFKATGERIEKSPIKGKVDADTKPFMSAMGKVEEQAKRVVSRETAMTVNANITRAEKAFDRAQQRLDYLKSVSTTMEVTADIKRAEANLQRIERNRDGLVNARAEMVVEVDGGKARKELQDVASFAEQQGVEGGKRAGSGLVASMDSATRGAGERVGQAVGDGVGESLEGALAAIPVAGGIILAGVAIGKAIAGAVQDGLQVEVTRDRLQALTGIDEVEAARLARAAGQAYANVFGESIEANLDAARLGVQYDIIDEEGSMAASQRVIEGLAGIADVMGEEVQPIARAVSILLRTGLVQSAQEAFDVIAAGQREGVNLGEDLLDTLSEYGSTFSQLGLTGAQSLGLLNQALEAGAPNTDFFADSLRELGIRVRAGEEETAGFISQLNLVPSEMRAAFLEGGPAAAAALDELLDALRNVEDAGERDRIAVGLLGTQFEDLQFDLDKLDLTTAEEGLNGVTGSAQRMFDTLSSNDASALDQAQRNVEVAVQGMQGALAVAFSDPLQEAATFVSENRGPMLEFFGELVNGALDLGEALIESAASGSEAFGEFVAGPLAGMVDTLSQIMLLFDFETSAQLSEIAQDMENFDDVASEAADTIRNDVGGALQEVRDNVNGFLGPEIAAGYLNDATLRLASAIDAVGYAADGATPLVDAFTIAQDGTVQANAELQAQVEGSVAALGAEIEAARMAGEGQEELAARYGTGTEALVTQLEQMGLNRDQAQALIDTILATPGAAVTHYSSNAAAEEAGVDSLANTIVTLPDGSVIVTANTAPAETDIFGLIGMINQQVATIQANASVSVGGGFGGSMRPQAQGSILEFMAQGGLTPMAPIAQMVPANTWRVVGDRSDVSELYAPLDGSPRSWALLMEGLRRMPGVMPMADGGVVSPRPAPGSGPNMPISVFPSPGMSEDEFAEKVARKLLYLHKRR